MYYCACLGGFINFQPLFLCCSRCFWFFRNTAESNWATTRIGRNTAVRRGLPCCLVPVWGSASCFMVYLNRFHILSILLMDPEERLRQQNLRSGTRISTGDCMLGQFMPLSDCLWLTTSLEKRCPV